MLPNPQESGHILRSNSARGKEVRVMQKGRTKYSQPHQRQPVALALPKPTHFEIHSFGARKANNGSIPSSIQAPIWSAIAVADQFLAICGSRF